MPEPQQWSPKCPKCGKLTNRVVEPQPNEVLGGRLSPRALRGLMGTRERCPRCATWFPLSEGTEWVVRPSPLKPSRPEGERSPDEEG